jgi:hypothetical protein
MSLGVNCDPENPANAPTSGELLWANVRWVRLVTRESAIVHDYTARMREAGIMVLAVITEQSQGHVCADCGDIMQCGNEPDLPNHGDSFSASKYVDYWNLYYGTWFAPGKPFAGVPLISAGLASGQTSYWQSIINRGGLEGCSGLAVHPYAKTVVAAKPLLLAYQRLSPQMPLWCTEVNRPTAEIPGFAAMLRQTVAMWSWFSWGGQSDQQFNLTETQARILSAC